MTSKIYIFLQITQHLFRRNEELGQDLKTVDIQRSRDHGVASYNDFRAYCNLRKAKNFTDFLDVMDAKVGEIFKIIICDCPV